MLHLIFLLSSHTVRLQTDPQPDLLHERSYRTCFEPDNPLRRTASLVSAHPHHHGCQEGIINPATSTFRLVVVGRPCCRRGPWWPFCPSTGGGPACVVARNSDVNVIRAPRGPAPYGGCPSSASRCALVYTVLTPTSATHATAPSDNPWYLKHLLLCVYLYGRLFRVHRQWAIFATCVWTVSSLRGTEANINDSPPQRAHTHAHVGT